MALHPWSTALWAVASRCILRNWKRLSSISLRDGGSNRENPGTAIFDCGEHMILKRLRWFAALLAGTCFAASVPLPSGTLTISGLSTTGVSFVYTGTLTQSDSIAFTQTGNPCLQSGSTFCTNGAGVVTVAGSTGVGGSSGFSGPSGVIPAGSWTYGALLMTISGVGTVQVFPTNAANGLESGTPPVSLTLPATTLSALGFGAFSQTNPTITFIVADTGFLDNAGQFVLSQAAAPSPTSVPTLSEWGLIALTMMLAGFGFMMLRRRA